MAGATKPYRQIEDPASGLARADLIVWLDESVLDGSGNPTVRCVPNDPRNSDWVAYEAWRDQGNAPDPPA